MSSKGEIRGKLRGKLRGNLKCGSAQLSLFIFFFEDDLLRKTTLKY
jgi:hypothetical protein